MDKPTSGKLYEQGANQDKEADSHAHKIFSEVSEWFHTSLQANQTKTEAFKLNVSENIDATNTAFKHSCEAVSNVFKAVSNELREENPEIVQLIENSKKLPSKAAHRIDDFYKTRPAEAVIETLIIPPVVIVDALVRGGHPQHKVAQQLTPEPEDTES